MPLKKKKKASAPPPTTFFSPANREVLFSQSLSASSLICALSLTPIQHQFLSGMITN